MENDEIRDQTTCKCDRWPVRLLKQGCLHDRCHRCDTNSAEASGVHDRDIAARCYSKTAALCPACEGTIKLPADAADDNMIVVGKLFRLGSANVPKTLEGLLGCEICLDQSIDVPQQAAAYFCEDCRVNLLCCECKQSHDKLFGDKHRVLPIEENDALGLLEHPWARIPPVLCRLHDSPCDHWCYSCDNAKCQVCALQCAKRFHSLCRSNELDLRSRTDQLCSSTLKIEEVCRKFRHVESSLELEHRADMRELKRRKTCILDALNTAFTAAHETLERSFRETRQRIANLRDSVDSSVRCSRLLTRRLLPSHGILIKCAQRAVDRHMHDAQRLMAREDAVLARLGSTALSENLEDVMKSWIGSPALLTVPDANEVTNVTLLADNAAQLQLQFPRYDIAATLCGHVLVAAGKAGLQELDSRAFKLDTWLPMPAAASAGSRNNLTAGTEHVWPEEVVSVDCLEDDRAVVGLKKARSVVLLKRESNGGSPEWREQQRFDLGQAAPFAIATRDNLLVVALGSINDGSRELLPGKRLAAFSVNNGIRQALADFDFEINSVVVAARNIVILASHFRVNLSSTCKGQFVIESRRSDLQHCLWRISRDHPILGLTASASGDRVYASVARERGRRVVALDADTGLITKGALANGCLGVQNDNRGFHSLVLNRRSTSRRRYDVDTSHSAANIRDTVGETRISTSDGTQHENWLTSNAVFGKLSCSKSLTSKLVALGFDSKTMIHLSADFEQPSLRDSLRRLIYLTKEFVTIFICFALALLSALVVTGLVMLCFSFLVMDLQAIGVASNRLMGIVVSSVAIYLLCAAYVHFEKATKSYMHCSLTEVQRYIKFPLIHRA